MNFKISIAAVAGIVCVSYTAATAGAQSFNAPTAGSTTQTINQPGVTTRTDLTTGRVGAPSGQNAQAIDTSTAPPSTLPNNNARAITAPAGTPIGAVNSTTSTTRVPVGGTTVAVGTPVPQNVSDQGTSAYDAAVTRQIRERITRSDLSMNARNVKIITLNGEVFLRGPVDSSTEQSTIQNIARDIVGSSRVRNETTVR